MGRFPVIVISCYNPNTPRSTEDEELLTTLLSCLIGCRSASLRASLSATGQQNQTYHEQQAKNALVLIGQIFPLLGLTLDEVLELMRQKGA